MKPKARSGQIRFCTRACLKLICYCNEFDRAVMFFSIKTWLCADLKYEPTNVCVLFYLFNIKFNATTGPDLPFGFVNKRSGFHWLPGRGGRGWFASACVSQWRTNKFSSIVLIERGQIRLFLTTFSAVLSIKPLLELDLNGSATTRPSNW